MKGRNHLEGARPNHRWTAGSSPAARGTKATQAGSQGIREIRSWVGGAARRNPVSPAPVSWPGSVGRFLLDPVSKSSFTEQPDRVCPGPVAHCRSPQSAGPVKVPCISPPAHPRPVEAFLSWYTHCSLSPHSSDPSSLPTRLTRSSWRLSVLFDVPLLPTRASPGPWSRPGRQ